MLKSAGSPEPKMLSSGSVGGGQLPAPFEQVRLLLQILGHAQPRFPDRGITGLLGELAIPRRQFPQLLWVFHCRPKPPGGPSENAENPAAFPHCSDKHFVPRGCCFAASRRSLRSSFHGALRHAPTRQ